MELFDAAKIHALQSWLSKSNIHDGIFRKAMYDYVDRSFVAEIHNPIWEVSYKISFLDVRYYACISDNPWSDNQTIIGLFVEKDPSGICEILHIAFPAAEDCMACLFEMISGNKMLVYCSALQLTESKTN